MEVEGIRCNGNIKESYTGLLNNRECETEDECNEDGWDRKEDRNIPLFIMPSMHEIDRSSTNDW